MSRWGCLSRTSATTRKQKGFDAGTHLSFSYYIITEQHQGHMAVTSDPTVGSTFHMELPLPQ